MGWMVDEYSKLVGRFTPAVITGKPLSIGGSLGREQATGFGGVEVLKQALKHFKLKKNPTVAVQGFGNVGYDFALFAQTEGMKVVALSDSKGGIYSSKGLDVKKIFEWKKQMGKLAGFPGSVEVSNEKLLLLPVDVLVPAALENVIDKSNARKIKAKMIIEMANGPTASEADPILVKRKIILVPDVLSNAGGVATSYLEWVQNLKNDYLTYDEVMKRLSKIMQKAFADVVAVSQEKQIANLRTAAFVLAIQRIAQVTKDRGGI
jgi:glutamate dehydrogenase/leucine dehydrogenase